MTRKRGRWSNAELLRVRELYGLRDGAAIARELKRPIDSVLRMVQRLFPPQVKSGPWTASETLELKRYLGVSSSEVIARILGRSLEEVKARILDLGRIRRGAGWTREELAEFKRIYGSRSDEALSLILARGIEEIRQLAHEHALSKDKAFMRRLRGKGSTQMLRWRADELEILARDYPSRSNLEIARRLGRSVKSVVAKAHHMHLTKSSERLREMGRENVNLRYGAQGQVGSSVVQSV